MTHKLRDSRNKLRDTRYKIMPALDDDNTAQHQYRRNCTVRPAPYIGKIQLTIRHLRQLMIPRSKFDAILL
jgi:hypothetical protein